MIFCELLFDSTTQQFLSALSHILSNVDKAQQQQKDYARQKIGTNISFRSFNLYQAQ